MSRMSVNHKNRDQCFSLSAHLQFYSDLQNIKYIDYCKFRPWLASECSSCRVRTGIVWPGRCCYLVRTSRCVCWPEGAALRGCWWRTPEPARGKHYWGALHHKHTHKRWLAYGAFKVLSWTQSKFRVRAEMPHYMSRQKGLPWWIGPQSVMCIWEAAGLCHEGWGKPGCTSCTLLTWCDWQPLLEWLLPEDKTEGLS